ncbi:Endonuclease/Exonuclease/phosphatase family protein [Bremerella volcania]|uniref:Endonuclease/Exonuclease/phosphatase family protein n=1 Tax=Bremerella volcania TaxID=2527984 RepID=A0A518CEE8_9BACT|nr:endonuclease/exonuclease/phosphatase family protein [Bremerella volcania]QDU77603.1 Endonuclease/Exonuclease/phosphatase family protein [Bremerella volcania]
MSTSLKILMVLLALVFAPTASADEPIRIRVVSYNIHHGEGTDGKLDLSRIAQVVSDAKPDIIALQEVDRNTKRTGNVDQAAELARLLEMNGVFGGNIDLQGGHYGNAILTRYASISSTNHQLPSLANGEQRGVMEADIAVPGFKLPLKFLATHYDHRPDENERIASCEMIAQLTRDWGDRPALLAGDLNALPESKPLMLLEKDWIRSNREVLPTIPSDQPTRQIDYILLRPNMGWKVVECRLLDGVVASDHRGILAVLEWSEPASN